MNTNPDQWSTVDQYLEKELIPADAVMQSVLAAATTAKLPPIQVSPAQGKLLHLLVRSHAALRILEIGTLGGYSTIWLARALPPGGLVVTLEVNPNYAAVARENFQRAGLTSLIDLRVGSALETLPRLAGEGAAPFDFIFIDADKASTPQYFQWAINLARSGTVIVVDNVVRKGGLIDTASADADIQGMRRFVHMLGTESRVSGTVIQTVGSKGYDGFAFALVL